MAASLGPAAPLGAVATLVPVGTSLRVAATGALPAALIVGLPIIGLLIPVGPSAAGFPVRGSLQNAFEPRATGSVTQTRVHDLESYFRFYHWRLSDKFAKQNGAKVPFIRPSYLSKPNIKLLDVLAYSIKSLERKKNYF